MALSLKDFTPKRAALPAYPVSFRMVLVAALFAVMMKWRHDPSVGQPMEPGQPQLATGIEIAYLVIAIGLLVLSAYLASKADKATLKDDKPTTLVTRGSFINWILGVRRIGPLFAWAGDRFNTEESSGKKGLFGDTPKIKIWWESGMHILCVGPAFCLHRILNNGKAVFQGPITRNSHPSGTFIDLGSEGGFYIYWGEPTQPINASLGDSSRIGVASRWPYHCYVYWAPKRLGTAAHWPLLDYELEVRVEDVELTTHNEPHMLPSTTLNGPIRSVFDINENFGNPDYIELDGSFAHEFPAKGIIRTQSIPGLADQDLEILFTTTVQVQVGVHPIHGLPIFNPRTRVFFEDGALAGATTGGTIQLYTSDINFGINAAHAIATMLFNSWPRGLGLAKTGTFAAWDVDDGPFSLENLATLLDENNEDLRTSWLAKGGEGESVSQVLGLGLMDLGVMVPMNADSGLIEFRPIREPSGTLRRLRDDALVDALPEVEVKHLTTDGDRLTFAFADRQLTDRDATIAVMDDGNIELGGETQHAKKIQLTVTTDFATASAIAQRRSQEELGQGTVTRIKSKQGDAHARPRRGDHRRRTARDHEGRQREDQPGDEHGAAHAHRRLLRRAEDPVRRQPAADHRHRQGGGARPGQGHPRSARDRAGGRQPDGAHPAHPRARSDFSGRAAHLQGQQLLHRAGHGVRHPDWRAARRCSAGAGAHRR